MNLKHPENRYLSAHSTHTYGAQGDVLCAGDKSCDKTTDAPALVAVPCWGGQTGNKIVRKIYLLGGDKS